MYSSFDISVLSHATEDEDKLLNCLKTHLGRFSNLKKVELIKTEGHWKNPIIRINLHYTKNSDSLYSEVVDRLSYIYGKDDLKSYLDNNVDEKGSVYLRLDKQKLCSGELSISEKDSVRLVFKRKGKFSNNNDIV
ncbi:MAG TPA: RNA-binding domain-containing protein [Candidatus Nitrosocosmicus sp.]|nr:RNA-binding domain-containing protein [Candidatus Nitrosocosmicus sp.]